MPVSFEEPAPNLWGDMKTATVDQTPEIVHYTEAGGTNRSNRLRVPIARIDVDTRNPRAPDDADVQALASSIAKDGLLQPIVVRPSGNRYTIVAGHRRFAALRRCAAEDPCDARWRSVDVVVRHIDEDEALALMLVENLQRKAFTPLEEAVALQRLRVVRGWTNKRVGEAVHKSEMYVSRRLRVLDDTALSNAVLAGHLAITTAEELLAIDDRAELIEQAAVQNWSPAEARRAVQARRLPRPKAAAREESWRSHIAALEELLSRDAALTSVNRQELGAAVRRLVGLCRA
jgi:ParB family chromosome partitioning protein